VSSSYFHGRRVTDLGKPGVNLKESNRNFLSIIRRARVSQSPENKSILFTEYEIVCQMRLLADTLAEKEIVYKWSVWKRFSEFVILHKVFRYPTIADIVINLLSALASFSPIFSINTLLRLTSYPILSTGDREVARMAHEIHASAPFQDIYLRQNFHRVCRKA
jgi:hypothetical protein